jgi:L-iditol 2-dehydrogenase
MTTMRAAVLYDVDDIRIEQRPIPKLDAGELLVAARASGICTGDILAWYVRRKAPLVLGHETAGTIAAIGAGDPPCDDNGKPFALGDRVTVHHHAPCFTCAFCARGDYVQCATWRGSKIDPGGLAEFFRVPRENVRETLRLPESVPFVDGSLVEPLACVMKSLRRGGVRANDTVTIIGLGVMGLLHTLAAQELGARVVGSDFRAERRELAARLGAVAVHPDAAPAAVRGLTEGRGADVVVCGPGAPGPLRDALALAAPGGTVVMFTPLEPGTPFSFDPNDLYFRDLRLVGSYSCGPDDMRAALDLIARAVVTAKRLEATEFPLEAAGDAYRALAEARIIKPIVVFEPSLFP